ncbi:MAG: hypothetical protein K0R12_1200 [Gammaproteobacteria bacterium]|jgi:hypothetical protein|nr:hypothetical protein [Gammaproteobacteria bacterium]
MNTISELNMAKQNIQDVAHSHYRFFRIIFKPLKYFLYFAIIQVLWVNFSNYQSSIDARFAQLNDGIIDVALADNDYIRRCHLIENNPYEATQVYPVQTVQANIKKALGEYLKAFHRLNGLISYSSYLKLHEFSYCYSNNILNNLEDSCNLYSLSVSDVDKWKSELLHTVEIEHDSNLSFFTSIKNFFTKKSNKKYPMPTFSYGLCNAPINNTKPV